ncbi:hypothetical protein FEV16_08830 [Methylocystis sp. B8]|nr:hypothetical protein FEV16_08830 [Methylocystis sp. B8]
MRSRGWARSLRPGLFFCLSSRTLDHAAFGRNRPNADNVIDSKSLERALREKPDSTFSQRALCEGAIGVEIGWRADRYAGGLRRDTLQ